ncbi:MAG: hypothetical protein LBR64_08740 [Dysgonamonadaceae bacterium]|jgi:hypothetical protein|nr:hypothetical protein [Dysgonamonadaceae bacterium]
MPDSVIFDRYGLPLVFKGVDFSYLKLTVEPLLPEMPRSKPLLPLLKPFTNPENHDAFYRDFVDSASRYHPELFSYLQSQLPEKVEHLSEMSHSVIQNLFTLDFDLDIEKKKAPERFTPKRRYWTLHGNNTVKLSQSYLSGNWYKGGSGKFCYFVNIV